MRKMLPWLVSLLLAITLIVIVGLYSWSTLFDKSPSNDAEKNSVKSAQAKPMTADEKIKVTSELNDIKTNIGDNDYIVTVSLSFQFDSVSAKEEFDKVKEFDIKPIVNKALWVMQPDELVGTQGKDKLCADLLNAINPVLTKGKLSSVAITNFWMAQI